MATYYAYFPCPGSTGTIFYSNDGLISPSPIIRFDSGSSEIQLGKCFHLTLIDLEVPPSPLVVIDWMSVTYTTFKECVDCEETPLCGECPEGYTLVDGDCVLVEVEPAVYTGELLLVEAGNISHTYTQFGLRLYPDISALPLPILGYGYSSVLPTPCTVTIPYSVKDNNGAGAVVTPILSGVQSKLWGCSAAFPTCQTGTSPTNSGRLMTTGVWNTDFPLNEELSFEFCVNLETTKQYLIGIAGDNKVKIYIDNVLHVFLDVDGDNDVCASSIGQPYIYWHVFPITLTGGPHTIKIAGINLNSQGSFGAEIYDISLSQFQSILTVPATAAPNCGNIPTDIDPYVVFSTKDYIGQLIPDPSVPGVWECPEGYVLDVCNGIPQCTKTTTAPTVPCAYQLVSCCNPDDVYLVNITDYGTDGIYLYININPELPAGCYAVSVYTGQAAGIPTIPFTDLQATGLTECNLDFSLTNFCPVYCPDLCTCTRVRLKPEYVTPGDPGFTTLTYVSCQLIDNGEGQLLPDFVTLNIPINGDWSEQVCTKGFIVFVPTFEFQNNGDCIPNTVEVYECPKYYQLVNCEDTSIVLCVSNNLSEQYQAGETLTLNEYPNDCWTIEELEVPCLEPVNVTITQSHIDCADCLEKLVIYYELVDCNNPGNIIYTTTDLSAYVGQWVSLTEYPGECWFVYVSIAGINTVPLTVFDSFSSCEQCNGPFYLLEDCNILDPQADIITSTDLSAYVGQVITLDYCPEICWQVSETDISTNNQITNLNAVYTSCLACQVALLPCVCTTAVNTFEVPVSLRYIDCNGYQMSTPVLQVGERSSKVCALYWVTGGEQLFYGDCIDNACPVQTFIYKSVRPGYDTPGCSIEKYERIMCNFSEGIYKQILSVRYGIDTCCGEDSTKWEIKKELIELAAITDPDFNCVSVNDCGCNGSIAGFTLCVPEVVPVVVCHTYQFIISAFTGVSLNYLNCEGVLKVLEILSSKTPIQYTICGQANQSFVAPTGVVTFEYTETAIECTDIMIIE
jgi:hypothetical protein